MDLPARHHRSHEHRSFDIWNEVPLVPQTTGMSCWAAAASMLVGWREALAVRPDEVAQGVGRWEAFVEGLEPRDVETLSRTWGLHVVEHPSMTPEGLRSLLEQFGPLWLGEASPGLHSIVVAGIHGDGTDAGTFVRINDPWPVGEGERYMLSVPQLRANFRAATDAVGAHAQMLHSGGRGRSTSRERHHCTTTINDEASSYAAHSEQHMDTFSTYGRPFSRSLGTIAAGGRFIATSSFATDPLASHGGTQENLYLGWNELPDDAEAIDVVVHLHGYSSHAADRAFLERKVNAAGVELDGRTRPTLALVPRGRKITAAELRDTPRANPARYTFPGLLHAGGQGLEGLVAQSLAWLSGQVMGRNSTPAVARVILTAHSGGGAALDRLLRNGSRRVCNPEEVHVFDATYGRGTGLDAWLAARIGADRTSGGALRPDMRERGGALRLFFVGGGTEATARAIASSLRGGGHLGGAPYLEPFYRVEQTTLRHRDVASSYGPRLLADAASDVPDVGARIGGTRYGTPLGLFKSLGATPHGADPDGYGVRNVAGRRTKSLEEIRQLGAEGGASTTAPASALTRAPWARGFADYAPDATNPNLRHVATHGGASTAFTFTAANLRALGDANHFPAAQDGRVLFGLRGCSIVSGGDGNFHSTVELREAVPDHINNLCVLGVWNVDTDELAVFTGSTVPNEYNMQRQVDNGGQTSNMLLTGFHSFTVGTHRGHQGTFVEAQRRVILRTNNDLVYETSDDFESHNPADNLHPSFEPHLAGGPEQYSSAGCLTVVGDADTPDQHFDPADGSVGWDTFRQRAGLTGGTANPAERGIAFKMILVTGREARVAAGGQVASLHRLRFGSQGAAVTALQNFLVGQGHLTDGDVDGDFGPTTGMAWVASQQARDGGHADGIVTPDDGSRGGFSVDPAAGESHAVSQGWARALVDENSTQTEQSDQVRLNLAQTVSQWESGRRFDAVHNDSNRVNFGIGSWTGTRIADVLDTYAAFAANANRTAQLMAHFGGAAGFDAIRGVFLRDGARATITNAQRNALRALGRDTDLQGAQDQHLANDLRADLRAIGGMTPSYPYYDGGMGAVTEVAAHVLVHARHQSGGPGFPGVIRDVIAHFGGDAALGRSMVAGTVSELDVLRAVRDQIVARVQARYRTGVRNRYNDIISRFSGSPLSYYFLPQN